MKKIIIILFLFLFTLLFTGVAQATDYEFYRGDDHTFNLTFTSSTGTPVDITGWVVYFTLKNLISDTDAAAEIQRNITAHDDAVAGETSFVIYSTEAASFVGRYRYDIQYKNDTNKIRTFLTGVMEFIKDVTIRTTP